MTDRNKEMLLDVRRLSKFYERRGGILRARHRVAALEGVEFNIPQGRTLALVGESGSGKSTLARCLIRLEEPESGEIWFNGQDILALSGEGLRSARRQMQLIFQDPVSALNPGFAAWEIVSEPLAISTSLPRREWRKRALELMSQVGLPPEWASRKPAEFSGGQRQRLAIARALSLEPKLLILDEALSALDLSMQAQIVNLLLDLQEARGLSYLFISHDVSLAGFLADEMMVLQQGRVVERGTPANLFQHPAHPHTRALVAAIPAMSIPGMASGQSPS